MQSLEATCSENDYLLNESFCKLRSSPVNQSNSHLVFDQSGQYPNLPSPLLSSSPSRGPSFSPSLSTLTFNKPSSNKNNNHRRQFSEAGSPSKKFKNSTDGNANAQKHSLPPLVSKSIYDKLRELYFELLLTEETGNKHFNKRNLRCTSFLLEKLVLRDNLNTLIINLYPGNKGYSLAFKKNTELSGLQDVTNYSSICRSKCNSKAENIDNENLQETMRWPYEEEDLLDALDNEELPLILVDLIESKYPQLFYSGCIIAEVRDYRQSYPITTCDTYHVLLRPTNQTIYADINLLTAEKDWSPEERLAFESQIVLAISEPLCLDPDPSVGKFVASQQARRHVFNTPAIRRQAKKFSQVSINRKRKLDQFTHNYGLELSDFVTRYRQRPPQRHKGINCVPKKPVDVVAAIKAPNLDGVSTLTPPTNLLVSQHVRAFESRPNETPSKDCGTQLIEDYVLETDRGSGRVYHIKLSIFRRPSNLEYLGELYVDRDYKDGEKNGESCRFVLGTREHASRYIQQFTEIFTEEGRKSVKITHTLPGQAPKVSFTVGMREARTLQQQPQSLPQQSFTSTTSLENKGTTSPTTTNLNNLAHSQIQQFQPQVLVASSPEVNSAPQIQIFQQTPHLHAQFAQNSGSAIQGTCTIGLNPNGGGQQNAQLNLSNGSLLLVQQTGVNVSNCAMAAPNSQNMVRSLGSSVPILQAKLRAGLNPSQHVSLSGPTQQHGQPLQIQQPATLKPTQISQQQSQTIHSTNPQINALVTSFINTENQLNQQRAQQQAVAAAKSNNTAIINLLNSGPAPMTSSAVATTSCGLSLASPQENSMKPTGQQSKVTTPVLQQQMVPNRILNHTNMIAVSPVTSLQQVIATPQQHTIDSGGNVRTMSALATQLASPPAIISTASLTAQGFNFQPQQSNSSHGSCKQLVLNTSNAARLLNRRVNSTGEVGLVGQETPMSGLITTSSPPVTNEILSATTPQQILNQQQQSNSALIERLTSTNNNGNLNAAKRAVQSPGASPNQFATPSPKQSVQLQSPAASISPLSSPPPQQINLQGLNISSIQGAMASIPGLQNVQVQIPGLVQPISLQLSSNSGNTQQATSLLVSVPVTSTINTINAGSSGLHQSIGSGVLNSIAVSHAASAQPQTVVFTNSNAQTYAISNLPLAQIMTSTVKGLNQQQLRNVSGQNVSTSASIQLLGIQKPRNLPVGGHTVQFATARGIVTPQRNVAASNVKIASPISAASSQIQPNAMVSQLGNSMSQNPQVPNSNAMSQTQIATTQNNNNKNSRRKSAAEANNINCK